MRRRQFIGGLAGAAAWPLAVRAQQHKMPVIGFLVSASHDGYTQSLQHVSSGLEATGYVEGQNLAIEYRWADYQYDRLPALATDLVGRSVAVIFATGSVVSALAAKSATSTIPIVFAMGSDAVKYGLVTSINRPGGNITGASFYNSALGPRRIELLRELVPKATVIAVLVNPNNPNAELDAREIQEGGRSIGLRIEIVNARSEDELHAAFANLVQLKADALLVHIDALFQARAKQIIALAAQNRVPTIYSSVQFTRIGGLMSYGTDSAAVYRQGGIYVGRVLNGEKPADLPILQPTKFDLTINLRTAKALGLSISEAFLLRADEVIE